MRNLSKVLIIFGAGFLLGFLGSFYIFQKTLEFPALSFQSKTQVPEKEEINVQLMIDFGDGEIITCSNQKLTQKRTVFDLLEVCSKNEKNSFELEYQLFPGLGVLITKIGDKENGQDDKYWQYWVNNEYSEVGADSYQLKDGDFVEWKFIKSQF